jgi:hypothetical protein
MPPEMTISAAPMTIKPVLVKDSYQEKKKKKRGSISMFKIIPIPSRTDRLGLIMSLELMRKISPR